jgi:hypothetical protein
MDKFCLNCQVSNVFICQGVLNVNRRSLGAPGGGGISNPPKKQRTTGILSNHQLSLLNTSRLNP